MKKYNSIVLNVPHSSIEGLCDSNWTLEPEFFSKVKKWTDWYTDYLFRCNHPNIKMVRSSLSRFVIDTERLLDDPLEEVGQGIIYTSFEKHQRTLHNNEESLLMHYYNSYIQQLRNALTSQSLLIDCHSFPSSLSDKIDVCIGYNNDWSKPDDETIKLFVTTFESYGFRVGINDPYSNSISPECKFYYSSIMVELNKSVYMNEDTLDLLPEYNKVRACLHSIYNSLLDDSVQSHTCQFYFSSSSLPDLVNSFNAQVGNHGWSSARTAHDQALIDELVHRGVDVSVISDGHSISFAHHVVLDDSSMKLIIQN